jgi:hypothetical protein
VRWHEVYTGNGTELRFYSAGTAGAVPTHEAIAEVARRSEAMVRQLREWAQIAERCPPPGGVVVPAMLQEWVYVVA